MGMMSRGHNVLAGYCLGGIMPRGDNGEGIMSGGIMSGGITSHYPNKENYRPISILPKFLKG